LSKGVKGAKGVKCYLHGYCNDVHTFRHLLSSFWMLTTKKLFME